MRVTKNNVLHLAFACTCLTSSFFLLGTGIVELKRIVK